MDVFQNLLSTLLSLAFCWGWNNPKSLYVFWLFKVIADVVVVAVVAIVSVWVGHLFISFYSHPVKMGERKKCMCRKMFLLSQKKTPEEEKKCWIQIKEHPYYFLSTISAYLAKLF